MAEQDIKNYLARPDPYTDRVNSCLTWQVKKHPTVVLRDGNFCPLTYVNYYSLLKGSMTDESLSLATSTIELDGSFFEPEPASERLELEFNCTRTYTGVSSKEYHTTAKDISIDNIEHSIGQRSVESLTEEEFDFYLNEQLQQVDLSDRHHHILRKKPGRAKNTVESQIDDDGASLSKVVPTYSRQDTLTRRLTGQGFVQVDPQGSPPPRDEKKEKRTSKFSKSELKRQSELKRNQCQPVLVRLENIERHLKYLVSLADKDYQELWNLRGDYQVYLSDYKMLEKDTEEIKREWSSLPPVEGEDLMEDIDELHSSIKILLGKLRLEFDKKPSMKSSREKTIQEIGSECRDLYKQLVKLRSSWSEYCLLQPGDLDSWVVKRNNIDHVQQNLEMLKEKFDHLKLKAEKEKMHWQSDNSFAEFTNFYRTFYNDYIIYQIIFVKEEFTKFPRAGPNPEKAKEAKSILCRVYIVRIKELQITLEELMSGKKGDSPETSQHIEDLRKELNLIKKGVDSLETEWIVVDVGQADPVEDLSSLFQQVSHKLEESRIKIYRPPQRTKNLTKTEQYQVLETKKLLFQPYLDRLKLLRQQLSEILSTSGDEKPEDVWIRQSKIQKLSEEIEDSKHQMDRLILEWKEVPVQGFNIESDFKVVFDEINSEMKKIPRNKDGSFALQTPKKDIPSEKVKAKEDLKVKYEELNRKLEELRKLWTNYTSEQPTDERTWKLKKKNMDKIQSDLDDLRKEFVKLRTGIDVEWEVLEGDPSVHFEELYRGLHDDYTAYLISFAKEEFTRFPQAKPNQEKAREAKFALCQPYFVRIRELQVAQEELMKGGKSDSPETRKRIEELRKEMILVQKGVDALEMEWAGVDVGRSDPVDDLSRLFSQVSHKMEENRVKIYRPPQKTKKLTKEEQVIAVETKKSLFQPYLDKIQLLKQQLLEAINSVPEQEAPEELLIREKKVQKISNELSNTKNHVDQLSLEWKGVPIEGLRVEEDIATLYKDAASVLKEIPKGADGKFIIRKTIKVTQEKPTYQHLLDKLSELCKQLNAVQQDKSDNSRKGQDKKKKKIKELEKEIEATKKSLDKLDVNWRIHKVEGFDPYSNVGPIFFDFGLGEDKSDEPKEEPTEAKFSEDHTSKEAVKKPPYQHLLDQLSELSLTRVALSKENVKDSKQDKQKDKKLKELDNEIEMLVKELDKLDGNWKIHPVKGFDSYSNFVSMMSDLILPKPVEGSQISQTSDDEKMDLLKKKNVEYEPLLERLSALQKKWNELGLQIIPKNSKLKKQRDVDLKEVEAEMDQIKEKLTKLDEKWKDFNVVMDPNTVDPMKAVSDLFLSLKSQLASDKEPEASNSKSIERKEAVYAPLLKRMNEITIELEDTLKKLTLPGQDENTMKVNRDHIKQLKEESNKLSQELEALEFEWEDVQREGMQVPTSGTSIITQDPSAVFQRLKEKLRRNLDNFDKIQNSEEIIKKEAEAKEFKLQEYDPLLKRCHELQIKLSELLKPGTIKSEEELQTKVETIQKLEKEIEQVKSGMDSLDLVWKGVKVGDVDPIPETTDLIKKFNESVQTIKLKLPKKEDIAKEKAESKKRAYDPLLKRYHELENKLSELLKPGAVNSEEELQAKVETIQKLEKEIGEVKSGIDTLDLEWKGVKVGDVDPIPATSDLIKKFNESVQTVKLKLPKKEDIAKEKSESKKRAYDPFLKRYHELENKLSELLKPGAVNSEEELQAKVETLQKLEKEIGEVKSGMDSLDLVWKGVKVGDVDPIPETTDLIKKFNESVQTIKLKLPKKEDIAKEKAESKKRAYDPLLKRYHELENKLSELLKPGAVNSEEELQAKVETIQKLEKEIGEVKSGIDTLDLEWKGVKVGDVDPIPATSDLIKKFNESVQTVKLKLPKKEDIAKEKSESKKRAYDPFLKRYHELENKLSELLKPGAVNSEEELQAKVETLQKLEKEIGEVKSGMDSLDLVWKGVKVGDVDPIPETTDLIKKFNESVQTIKLKLPKKEDIAKEKAESKKRAYDPLLKRYHELENKLSELLKPVTVNSEEELQAKVETIQKLEKEIGEVKSGIDTLDLEWKGVKVGDVDPIPATSDLIKKFNESVQTVKLKLPKKEDIAKEKSESKKRAYDPFLKRYHELENKLSELLKPGAVNSEEELQAKVETLQKLEKEIGEVKSGMDSLDLVWKGVKVGDVDPIPETTDLIKKFNESVQTIKLKLPKKEDIAKEKAESKKRAYDPLLKRYHELENKLSELLKPVTVNSEEELQAKVETIQKLEKEIGEVKSGIDTLDLEWKGVKVGDVDPIPATSDLIKKFNESVQTVKLKLPKKEDIAKEKAESKKRAYDPLLKRYHELENKLSELLKPVTVNSEEELQAKVETIQKLEKEIGEVKSGIDTLDLEWKGVKVGDVDPIPATSDLIKKFNESVQTVKLKLPKKEDIAKEKAESKKRAYDPLLKRYHELENKLSELLKPVTVNSEEELQAKVETIQKLEKEIGEVKSGIDTLDLEWKGVKVGDVDPISATSDLIKKFNESVQTVKLKLPKKEDIAKEKSESKKRAYDPFLKRYHELENKLSELLKPGAVNSEEELQAKVETLQKLEKEIGEVKSGIDTLDLEWKGVKVGDVDPIPATSDLIKKFNESVQTVKLKLPKKEDIAKEKAESKKRAYDPFLKRYHELENKLSELLKPGAVNSEEELQAKVETIQKLEKEIGEVKSGIDTLDLEWKGVKVGDVDPIPATSDLIKKFNESVQTVKLKLPKKEDIAKEKAESKKRAYDPFLKRYHELENKLSELLKPGAVNSEEELQAKVETIQKLEKEIGEVKSGIDTLDLEWKGVKVGDVDPIPATSDLIKKFNESVQTVKLKLPKKEDIAKEKAESKKRAYDPFLKRYHELENKLSELLKPGAVNSEEELQAKVETIQKLEKEIGEVKSSIDTLDLEWKGVKVGDVDPIPATSDLIKEFNESVQTVKLKLPKKEDIAKEKAESKKRAYDPLLKKYHELENKLSELLKPVTVNSEEELQAKVETIQKLENEIGEVKSGIDTLDLEWKGVKVGDVDPIPATSDLIKKFNESVQTVKLKLPKKEDISKLTKANAEKTYGLEKLRVYCPILNDLKQLQIEVNQCGFHSPLDPALLKEKHKTIKELESHIEGAKNALNMLEVKWMDREAKFEPGTLDPALDAMQKLKKLEEEFYAVKTQAEKPREEVYKKKVDVYQPFKFKLNELLRRYSDIMASGDPVQKKFDLLGALESELEDIKKEVSVLDENWKNIPMAGKDPSLEVSEIFNSLVQQLQSARNNLSEERDREELLLKKEKVYQPFIEKLSALQRSYDDLFKSLDVRKDIKELEDALKKASSIEKDLNSSRNQLVKLELEYKNVPSKFDYDPNEQCMKMLTDLDGDLKKMKNNVDAKLKTFQGEMHSAKKVFVKEAESLENILRSTLPWDGLDNYQLLSKNFIHGQLVNVQNLESDVDAGLQKLETVLSQTTRKLQDINSPEASKEIIAIKKRFDGLKDSTAKWLKRLEQKKNQLSSQLQLKNTNLEKENLTEKSFNELQNYFMYFGDAKNKEPGKPTSSSSFSMENPDTWKIIQQYDRSLPKQMKSDVQESFRLVKQINSDSTNNSVIESSLNDIQVINQEKASTLSPDLQVLMNQKHKIKPSSWKFNIPLDMTSKFTWLDHHWRELKGKLLSKDQSLHEPNVLAKEVFSLREKMYQAAKPLSECVDHLRMDFEIGSDVDPKEALKALADVKKFHASLDAINRDLENCLKATKPSIPEIDSSLYSDASKDLEANIGKLENELFSKPDGKAEADKQFAATLKTKLDEIEGNLKSLENDCEQHLSLPANKRLPNKSKELSSACGDLESNMDGLKKMLGWKLSSNPSFFQHLTLPHSVPHIELRLNNLKNRLSNEMTKAQEGDDQTDLSSSHLQEYKKFLGVAEAALNEENMKTTFDTPKHLEKKIDSLRNLLNFLVHQRNQTEQSISCASPNLQQKLKEEKKPLDDRTRVYLEKGNKQLVLWLTFLSSWKDLLPQMQRVEREILEKEKRAKLGEVRLSPKELNGKLKQLNEIKRELDDSRPEVLQTFTEARRFLEEFHVPSFESGLQDSEKKHAKLDSQVNDAIKRFEEEVTARDELNALLRDYDKMADKLSKQLMSAKKLLNKKSPTVEDIDKIQEVLHEVIKDLNEAGKLKSEADKAAQNLLSSGSDDVIDLKLTKLDEEWKKLQSEGEKVKEYLGHVAPLALSKSQALTKLEEWLENTEKSLKEDDDSKDEKLRNPDDFKILLKKYNALNSDLPLQKALLSVLGFSLPVDTTSSSSGSHKTSIPQLDSSVDSLDEGLGDSLEPSPKESFELFQKFSIVSKKVEDRHQGLNDLESDVELLEREVKKFEKWIEGDAVRKFSELGNELNKVPVAHLPHKVKEFEDCLKAKEIQLGDLTTTSDRISKVTWPDASTLSMKNQIGKIKSRFIDLNGKLLELGKNAADKSEIAAGFNRHLCDCKALNNNARIRLKELEKPPGIFDFQSFSLHLNDLKNLKSSYSKDFGERLKNISDVADRLKIVCDAATKTDIDKSISDVQSERDAFVSDIDKYISNRESWQPDLVKFDELCCGIEEFIEQKNKQDFSVPPDDVLSKSIDNDIKKLQSLSKQLEDSKNDLSKKMDRDSASDILKRKSSVDPKVNKLLRRLKNYLDSSAAGVPKISDSEIDDLEVFLSEKLEPRLTSVGREKFKDAAELKKAIDGLQLLSQEMQSQSLKLHAVNESSVDHPLEAAAKDKLVKLNSRWNEGGTKLSNLVTVLRDKLSLLQSFPERCKEWENYLNVTQNEFSEKKLPENFESALELQSKIKSFLDQVPSKHCTLQTLVSDADQLSNDVLNKKSIQTKLSLLEDQWRTLVDQLKKKDLSTDGDILLWRQYLNSRDNTFRAVKDLEKDVEGAISPSDLTLSSLGWVKGQLEESQKILNSLDTKHFHELKALSDLLVQIVDSKMAKQVQSDAKNLTTRKEKLRKSTESALGSLYSISSELEDLDRKMKEYQQTLDGAIGEARRPVPEKHDEVVQELSRVEKLLHYLEPEKSLQEMEKQKNALKSRGVFNPSSTSFLDSKLKSLRTGRDSAVDLLLNRLSKLRKFLDGWSEFDGLHKNTEHEINAMNGLVGGGEQKTDLKNLLDFYANDFTARLGALQSSVDELGRFGNKLKAACNDPLKSKVEAKLKDIQDKHKSLQGKTSERMKHLEDAYRKLRKFEEEVPKFEDWLHSKEEFLCSPVSFTTSQKAELDEQKKSVKNTESDINSRAPSFEELSKLADDLLSNRDVCPTKFKTRSLSKVKEGLSKRWSALQDMLPHRNHFLADTESNWDAYKTKHAEFNSWLDQADKQLLALVPKSNKYVEAKSAKIKLKEFLKDVQSKSADLRKLNGLFGTLVSKLQIDQKGELKALNDSDNSRWSNLNSQAAGDLRRLDNLINMRDDFESKARALETFMQGLVRNLEQAAKSNQKKVRSRTSANARSELSRKTKHLENFNDSAKYLLEKADPSEKEEVLLKADHVEQLHARVKELIKQLDEDTGLDGAPVEDVMVKDEKAGRGWFFGRPTSGEAEEEDDDFKKLRQLEKWLDHAEDILLKEKCRPFTIQDFKEALKTFKDLDGEIESWKPDVVKIRHSSPKVAQLTAKSEKLCKRISDAGQRWDEVCQRNKEWGESLDSTILNSDLLHSDVSDLDDLLRRLTSELKRISDTPIDDSTPDLRIRQLCRDLGMVERGLDKVKPRLATLRQLHNHASSSPSFSKLTPERVSHLDEIGKHLDEQDTRLGFLSDGCLEERARLNRVKSERPDFKEDEEEWEELDNLEGEFGSPTSPSYWRDLLARGARTALPIQVLMLVLLGFASIVPICETNCFQGAIYSFTGGPPPT